MPSYRRELGTLPSVRRAFGACILSLSSALLAACGGGTSSTPTSGATTPPSTSTTLAASVSTLALSTSGLTEYGIAGTPSSGLARRITITNTGALTASALSVVTATALPSGTTMSTTCGSTLAPGASCTVTVTPGATATSDGTNPCTVGTTPAPAVLSVSGSNTNTVNTDIVVLGYRCISQGGFVYALDDTTSATTSVGGKVLTTTDQLAGIFWASDGSAAAYDSIYGIDETSTALVASPSAAPAYGQSACNGATDGACDTNNIYLYYTFSATNAPISLVQYAAGACKMTIGGHSDWYLPAICEMGYGNAGCGSSVAPVMQNAQSDLVDASGATLSGLYWSATEYSGTPQNTAWVQSFATGGSSTQATASKGTALHARCSRAF